MAIGIYGIRIRVYGLGWTVQDKGSGSGMGFAIILVPRSQVSVEGCGLDDLTEVSLDDYAVQRLGLRCRCNFSYLSAVRFLYRYVI